MISWEAIHSMTGPDSPLFDPSVPVDSRLRTLRVQFLHRLSEKTGRNVLTYYSGYLFSKQTRTTILDSDMLGFMNLVPQLDKKRGLDLILHTPGGLPTAAERIVRYLRAEFRDIRVIVPIAAMSAGTMIACSANSILMGNYSSLGPVDPQLESIPASDIIQEMHSARNDLKKDPACSPYWALRLENTRPGFYYWLTDARNLSRTMLTFQSTDSSKLIEAQNGQRFEVREHREEVDTSRSFVTLLDYGQTNENSCYSYVPLAAMKED